MSPTPEEYEAAQRITDTMLARITERATTLYDAKVIEQPELALSPTQRDWMLVGVPIGAGIVVEMAVEAGVDLRPLVERFG